MEVPDKLVDQLLDSVSNVLLKTEEEEIHKDKLLLKLAKSYNKLLEIAEKEYEVDVPYFNL